MAWYRRDKEAVATALQRGERPDLATTMASGPLDELVALQEELGIFAILDEVEVQRARAGVADELLVRTLATLPFVEQASLSGGSEVLFREPAVLLQLGWAPGHIRQGSNGRHRHPQGRQEGSLPCHPDTVRDALRRVEESGWQHVQQAGVQSLYARQLVRGKVYAVDGSGLGEGLRLVALVCVSATRPISVAWRVLSGPASEKGQEAAVTRALIEQVLQVAGPQAISLLLADALYADGPLLAWLYREGGQLWGARCQPVGLSHPRCDHPGNGCQVAQGFGEYAPVP
jgi:predicted RNA binding protein YcfA (HicA-like mRNA interferase family)